MRTLKVMAVAATAAFLLNFPSRAFSEDRASCSASITRANVVPCALAASLTSKSERLGLKSFEGRRRAAGVLLPSNPSVALGGGFTIDPSVAAADRESVWSATLSQEFEVGGQKGKRTELVVAEQRAQQARVQVVERHAAAAGLVAYFEALAAVEEARLAGRLGALASALKTVARARAEAGVAANVDAQLAESAATRFEQAQITAEQRVATTTATLATIVGIDPLETKPRVEGNLSPLAVVDAEPAALVTTALARRAELAVAVAEQQAQESRLALYERLRIPNPTISLFMRKDWIGERTAGIGLGFPIPLPAPLGRTNAGEIAEASSLARRSEADVEQLRRSVRLEVVKALEVVKSTKRQTELYPPEQVRLTEETLRSIAEEVAARRLPVREALLTQQGLIDFLFGSLEARRSLCIASVELALVAALGLEGAL